jgi:hypothetical protein
MVPDLAADGLTRMAPCMTRWQGDLDKKSATFSLASARDMTGACPTLIRLGFRGLSETPEDLKDVLPRLAVPAGSKMMSLPYERIAPETGSCG